MRNKNDNISSGYEKVLDFLCLMVFIGLAGLGCAWYYVIQRPNLTVTDDGILFIRPGDSLDSVVQTLENKGYIRNSLTFRKVAELKKYSTGIKPGRYRLANGMSNNEAVNMLRSGQQAPVHFYV